MKIFYSLNNFLKKGVLSKQFALTIGMFDGVHCAHQKVIKTLVKEAKRRRLASVLVTFDPHPANVLRPSKKVPMLISLKHRLGLLEGMGIDCAIVLRFNRRLSRMSAEGFIKKLFGGIRIKEVTVGEKFFFGRNRQGSLEDLKKLRSFYGYRLSVIKAFKTGGKTVSSTRIRKLILDGKFEKASRLLSRPVSVFGTVIRGYRRGRIIGYPTANINPHHEAVPPSGVYAVRIKLEGRPHTGILNIGVRPTFMRGSCEDAEPTIEVHIFGFNEAIYGREIDIAFVKKIREEKKFRDTACLGKQIKRDEKRARDILRRK